MSPLRNQLLRVAREEVAPPKLRERVLRKAHRTVALGAWFTAAKALGAVLFVGTAALGVYQVRREATLPPQPEAPVIAQPTVLVAPEVASVLTPPPQVAPPAPRSAEVPSAQPAQPKVPRASNGSLRDELRLLDAARNALARHDVAGARAALGQHRSEYPASALMQERMALEIETLAAAGDAGRAKVLLGQMRKHYPSSPALDRLGRLVDH